MQGHHNCMTRKRESHSVLFPKLENKPNHWSTCIWSPIQIWQHVTHIKTQWRLRHGVIMLSQVMR